MFATVRTRLARPLALALLIALVPEARAGSGYNLDFGTTYGVPAASYGGASGQTGTWNLVGLGASALVELTGAASAVSVTVVADKGLGNNASVPGSDDELLLNDNIFSLTGNSWSVDFSGLAPGSYDVLVYAPSNGAVSSGTVTVDGVLVPVIPGDGGSALIEGVSWVRVPVLLLGSTLSVSGIDPGFSGIAGLQLVPIQVELGFNVDFGEPLNIPGPSYTAGSSRPGMWNGVRSSANSLLDLAGNPTGVNLAVAWAVAATPTSPAPNNVLLLRDYIGTQSSGGTWSADFSGLLPGDYKVYLYAASASFASTGTMTVAGLPVASLPGENFSNLIFGVSYTEVLVTVTDGTLPISGTGTTSLGMAGIQLEYQTPPTTVTAYCTAGTSSSGCNAQIGGSGIASATASSGFSLTTFSVEGAKNGLYFFGTNGRQANSWGNGTSFQCVTPPVKRAGLLGSVGTPGACNGSFSQDLNAMWCPTCPNPAKNPGAGAVVQAQLWYRDPLSTSNQSTSLSDALEFTLAP